MKKINKVVVCISQTTKLTKGQLALYELILEANKNKFVISKERLKMIYINSVQRSMEYWNPWKEKIGDQWKGGYEQRSEWQLDINCLAWFTMALGSLIKKGYLTVIPKFNLKDAKELSQ